MNQKFDHQILIIENGSFFSDLTFCLKNTRSSRGVTPNIFDIPSRYSSRTINQGSVHQNKQLTFAQWPFPISNVKHS